MAQPVIAGGKTITVHGNSMLPLYRHGDQMTVSDRVPVAVGALLLMDTRLHGRLGGTLLYRDAKCIAVLLGGRPRKDMLINPAEVEYLGRIVWASQ